MKTSTESSLRRSRFNTEADIGYTEIWTGTEFEAVSGSYFDFCEMQVIDDTRALEILARFVSST